MLVIKTTYLPPTDTQGSKIKATMRFGGRDKQLTVSYPHEAKDPHAQTAKFLAERESLSGKWIEVDSDGGMFGQTPKGKVFVHSSYCQHAFTSRSKTEQEACLGYAALKTAQTILAISNEYSLCSQATSICREKQLDSWAVPYVAMVKQFGYELHSFIPGHSFTWGHPDIKRAEVCDHVRNMLRD